MSDRDQKNIENKNLFDPEDGADELEFIDAEIQQILDVLNEIPPVPLPEKFDLQFKRALKAEVSNKKRKKLYRRLSAVAALMVIGVLSYGLMNDGFNLVPKNGNSDLSIEDGGLSAYKSKTLLIKDFDDINLYEGELFLEDMPVDDENDGGSFAVALDREPVKENTKPWSGYQPNDQIQYNDAPQPRNMDYNYGDDSLYGTGGARGDEPPSADPDLLRDTMDAGNEFTEPKESAIMEEAEIGGAATGTGGSSVSGSAGSPSRSFSYYSNFEEFRFLCDSTMSQLVDAIAGRDALTLDYLLTGTEKQRASGQAEAAIKLYQDLFSGNTVSYKVVESQYNPASAVYEISGNNGQKITVKLKSGTERLEIHELLLDHASWLEKQLAGERYTLESFEYEKDTGDIVFKVRILNKDTGESTGEMRSVVWKKTES